MSDALLRELATDDVVGIYAGDDWSLVRLLADYLACVLGAAEAPDDSAFDADGVAGAVSALALRSAWLDRDDVDWAVLTHPGSVVWSAVLPVAAGLGSEGPALARAASLGYRAVATMAQALGPAHRSRWHVTATAGGFGAAAGAGALLELDIQEQADAFAHAAAAAGGIGQAAVERRGAAAFNRAAAASLGVQAVRAARLGAVAVDDPLYGERGLLALAGSPAAPEKPAQLVDGVAGASPRLFPVSGFGQGAVLAAALLGSRLDDEPDRIVVEVAEPAVRLMDGTTGSGWWSLAGAVAAAWTSGDAFRLDPSDTSRALAARVTVVPADLPAGGARVTAVTGQDTETTVEQLDPREPDGSAETRPWLERKWSSMQARHTEDVVALAEEILGVGMTAHHLKLLRSS